MFLYITGFLPEPNPDESLKYRKVVPPEHEQEILTLMGWRSLADGKDGEQEMDSEQAKKTAHILNEHTLDALVLFISTRS